MTNHNFEKAQIKFVLCVLGNVKKQTEPYKQGIIQFFILVGFKGKWVMRFGFIFISVIFILSACSSGPSESEFAPKIGDIETTIVHFHPSYYLKTPSKVQRTIGFTVSVTVSDPDGLVNVDEIYVRDINNNKRWTLYNSADANPIERCFEGDDLYSCSFYSPVLTDQIYLKGYEIVAVDLHGYTTRKSFEFKLPAGEVVVDEEFVYSESFPIEDRTINSFKGLEAMTIAGNALLFTLDDVAQTLSVEFETSDPRVLNYGLEFYDDSVEPILIGEVSTEVSSINPAQINQYGKTEVVIRWDEIVFKDGFDGNYINGLHVILFDQSTISTQGNILGKWFNYAGYSEFITLAP